MRSSLNAAFEHDRSLARHGLLARLKRSFAKLSFSARERERCWKKVGRQMRAARLPLEHCFHLLEHRARAEKSILAHVYADIGQRLSEGYSIGEAIGPYAAPEEVMLVDAGQTAGDRALAEGFLQAAELMEKTRFIKGAVMKELLYPCTLFLAMCAFLVVVATVIVPKLAALSNPLAWQGAGALLYRASLFVTSPSGLCTAIGLVLLAMLVAASLPRLTGRARDVLDRVPPWSVYRLLVGVTWLYATATLLRTRQKLGVILRKVVTAPGTTRYLRWRLLPVLAADERGYSLGDALCLAKSRWPDRHVSDDMRTYSSLPGFEQMLPAIAGELLEETVERVQQLARTLGGIAILAIVGLMLLLVVGLFGIQDQITSSVGSMGRL